MIFPVNFVIGAALGAVSTYIYKDEASKKWLRETGNKLKNSAYSLIASPEKASAESATQTGEIVTEEMTEKNVAAKTENTDTPKPRRQSKSAQTE